MAVPCAASIGQPILNFADDEFGVLFVLFGTQFDLLFRSHHGAYGRLKLPLELLDEAVYSTGEDH